MVFLVGVNIVIIIVIITPRTEDTEQEIRAVLVVAPHMGGGIR